NIPRPRKIKPVQVMTRLDVSGSRVEKMRMAVVCQHVTTESHKRICQIRNVQPNFGLRIGSNPAAPIVTVILWTMFRHPEKWTAYMVTRIVAIESSEYCRKSVITTETIPPSTV